MMRFLGGGFHAPDITVDWAWSGNISATGATILARARHAGEVTLRYGTDPSMPNTVEGVEGAPGIFTFDLSSLSADTAYQYGFTGSDVTGQFRTFPTPGTAHSFTIATASCAGYTGSEYKVNTVSNTPAFDRIADREPLLFIHLGDRGYSDIATNSPPGVRANYNANMAMERQRNLHLAVPVAYIWSDDDFGTDNANTDAPAKPAAQQVYREYVPHWPLPVGDSIQQTFVIGRVRVILLDCRSYRTPNGATDNSSKTRLGATQKQWLKDTLLAATEPLILVSIESPWIGNGTDFVSWGIVSTERAELANFFEDNDLVSRVVLFSGDHHLAAGDDGTNTNFATGNPPGVMTVTFAPLDGQWTDSSGTWSEGEHIDSHQQYGTLDIVDDGDSITLTAKGWAVSDETEAEMFSLAKVF